MPKPIRLACAVSAFATLPLASLALAQSLDSFPLADRDAYLARERDLIATPDAAHLLKHHTLLASEPHIAGSPGDRKVIDNLAKAFREFAAGPDGSLPAWWSVETHEIWPLLSTPIAAQLAIVTPLAMDLSIRERPIDSDPITAQAAGAFGWLAYSGSGDVTAEVVYANYGTKADFETLKTLGVDIKGKVVLCRYGGNYRGYKVKFAQEMGLSGKSGGAAAVVIYSDPADAGFVKGAVYPEGSWANDCCIQRGSLATLPFVGDPLTPFREATKDAKRDPTETVDLPDIPAQPCGWNAAVEIMKRMSPLEGTPKLPEGWKGGMPCDYALVGGPDLKVRVKVEQKREIKQTANVLATLVGATEPEFKIIIGCHHDAWNCGAADPTCGTITMLEAARAFAEAAKKGWRPARTIIFAAWTAEEFGIIGSTEWVEAHAGDLAKNGVAYINLDMASMGPNFGSGATPSLSGVILDAARVVPQARGKPGETVFDRWLAGAQPKDQALPRLTEPRVGDLGGGSDHVAFAFHIGMSAASFGGSGSEGNSYHSAYDTLPWYWKTVGDDYEPALMVTRMAIATAARLASTPVAPLNPSAKIHRLIEETRTLAKRPGLDPVDAEHLANLEKDFIAISMRPIATTTRQLVVEDRMLNTDRGLSGRPWYKTSFCAPDEDSGYSSWVLPEARRAIERRGTK